MINIEEFKIKVRREVEQLIKRLEQEVFQDELCLQALKKEEVKVET